MSGCEASVWGPSGKGSAGFGRRRGFEAEEHIPLYDDGTLGTRLTILRKASLYVCTADDTVILADATVGGINVLMPADPGLHFEKMYVVKKIDSSGNGVFLNGQGNNIDGATTFTLTAQYQSLTVISDGVQWWKIGAHP